MQSLKTRSRIRAISLRRRAAVRAASCVVWPFSSIAGRLIAVVLVTGILAFGALGSLTYFRFDFALRQQADALGRLSERQLANRLNGEAQLARARIEAIGSDLAARLRQVAQRRDLITAVESRNEVTIRELFDGIARTSGFDRLLAFDQNGRILATDDYLSLIQIYRQLQESAIPGHMASVLTQDNSRNNIRSYEQIQELSAPLAEALDIGDALAAAHLAIEPVFDDFGELIGALAAVRVLGRSETTLDNFTTLSNAGVVIMRNNDVVSAAGPKNASFARADTSQNGLIYSDDGAHVARCVSYAAALNVCTFTDASVVTASRDQMFRIGAVETKSMMSQFLASAAATLTALVVALLLVVRHTTRGLSTLAAAAGAVADGNLHVKIKARGVGEVYTLSVAFIRMLSNLRRSMGRVEQLAFFDTVTRLPNREKIRLTAPDLINSTGSGAFFFVDLDGFKSINDTFGHRAGDGLLKQVADRLIAHFSKLSTGPGQEALVARVGGDEFVIIFPGAQAQANAGDIARGVIRNLQQPFDIGGSHVTIGASIGITVFPDDGTAYEALLVNADLAMYAAKDSGRNSFAFFTHELAEQAKTRLSLESDLKNAVANEELTVHYQPKLDCRSGEIRGVEALVRWNHPRSGYIAPPAFLGIAEEIGLISDIDRFVVKRAVEDIGTLIESGANLVLAVNATATEIEDPRFLRDIALLLKETGFPPSCLEIEITESVALQNPEAVSRRVAHLRRLGVRLAIDDFGAGYSNLATLARLPFDTLKLDRSLVHGVSRDPEKQSIVRIALGLARELGLDSVAEGIESTDDFNFVARQGATMAQGFFFSPAIPLSELSALIASTQLEPRAKQPQRPASAVAGA